MTIPKLHVGQRLFLCVLSIFVIFAASLILFQQSRERQYKRDALNSQLQEYNYRIFSEMERKGMDFASANNTLETFPNDNLRLTIIGENGNVLLDSEHGEIATMTNHSDRIEIREAKKNGAGSDYDRNSTTTGRKYFYSATYFPTAKVFVRTALPYDDELADNLKADQHYIWVALFLLGLLSLILWQFLVRLGNNIENLQKFAIKVDRNESLTERDIESFHKDELGDIAKRIVRLYKRLTETQEQQTRLKKELTQNVAHELKTPVASIHGYMETLLTNPDIPQETRLQFMERCFVQTKRLSSLIQDISTLNKLDDKESETLSDEPVDISAVIATIMNDTALQRSERKMEFCNKLPQGVVVRGEYSLIYSIFRNLTDNAIAYAGDSTTITLQGHETRTSWFFEFSDNGVGVPEKCLPRLFERFYRVDKGRSRSMGGTGLGLAIVKNAILRHGGTISAMNRRGGGLIFLFSLKK
ncbi:MAG: ATP-binding protein [Bacteroidales bacterium]|nr:ATP-binding protein [Bacteroidales bacterium]